MLLPPDQLHPRSVINGSNVLAHIEEAAPLPESLPSAMTHGQRPMTHDLDLGELGPHLTTSPRSPAHQQPCTLQLFGHQTWGVSISCELTMAGWSCRSCSQLVSQFSLKLTRDGEPYHTPGTARRDMPCCDLCRVCCVVFVPVVSLRSVFEVTRLESTQRATSPILPAHPGLTNMLAWLSPSSPSLGGLARPAPT